MTSKERKAYRLAKRLVERWRQLMTIEADAVVNESMSVEQCFKVVDTVHDRLVLNKSRDIRVAKYISSNDLS